MARSKGTMKISSNIEPRLGAPLDARMVVPTLADLPGLQKWSRVSAHRVPQISGTPCRGRWGHRSLWSQAAG